MKNTKPNCELREVQISMSQMDFIHSNFRTIKEFYVPEHHLCFNIVDNTLHVFLGTDTRYADCKTTVLKKIYVDDHLINKMLDYLATKEAINDQVIGLYNECGRP